MNAVGMCEQEGVGSKGEPGTIGTVVETQNVVFLEHAAALGVACYAVGPSV